MIALEKGYTLPSNHITLWICLKTLAKCLLTLQPHRDTHLTQDAYTLMSDYCIINESYPFVLQYFDRAWLSTPPKMKLQDLMEKRDELPPYTTPKDKMWAKILADYIPHPTTHLILPVNPPWVTLFPLQSMLQSNPQTAS